MRKVKKMVTRMNDKGLINHLQRWGLKVDGNDGWRTRGRPYNFYPRAIIAHHTASSRASGNFGSERVVVNGRPDLSGPLCQVLLGRDGSVRLIASGYANHAGYGGPKAGIPANQGNTYAIGIEAENDGRGEPWSKAQLNAYYRLCASLLVWIGVKDVSRVIGHKEWTTRKTDPAGINMNTFRSNVQKALNAGPSVKTVNLSKVQPGKRNEQIKWIKKRLAKKGFYNGNVDSNFFGKKLTKSYLKWESSVGANNPDGIPNKKTLKKLGFRVVP